MIINIEDDILKIHSLGLLDRVLVDKTTKKNIIWATDNYEDLGLCYGKNDEIRTALITGSNSDIIKTRARKAMEQQSERTKQFAEVFTPLWVVKKMNDYADEEWFGRENVFFRAGKPTEKVVFDKNFSWQRYVDSRRMEITCGEAPYLVSRYDVETGEMIPISKRIGILDRKLRIINENTTSEEEWLKWTIRAFENTYGYEFQGDSLLIARMNLLMTFEEYLEERWHRKPREEEYKEIISTIVWNIWQMDGLTGEIPYSEGEEDLQFNIFEIIDPVEKEEVQTKCVIFDWRSKESIEYNYLKTWRQSMKFDFIIGNPPYQDETVGEQKTFAPPIYHKFLDGAYSISDKVEMIHPARFLFNAGSTPKEWNRKMLTDPNLKVLWYEAVSSNVFPNTDIKGGWRSHIMMLPKTLVQ